MKHLKILLLPLAITLILCLVVPSTTIGQISKRDTVCIKEVNFKYLLKQAEATRFLREVVKNDSIMINNLEIAVEIEKKKARKQKWIIGGTLGAGLTGLAVITLLSFLK